MNIAVVLTTVDDEGVARDLGARLVDEKLVACAQIETAVLHSVYRWKGEVESAAEWRLVLKLPEGGVERLRQRLTDLHPYETPEFVVLTAGASGDYARWVADSCS